MTGAGGFGVGDAGGLRSAYLQGRDEASKQTTEPADVGLQHLEGACPRQVDHTTRRLPAGQQSSTLLKFWCGCTSTAEGKWINVRRGLHGEWR